MQISARNRLAGKVLQCRTGAVNAEVEIDLGDSDRLVAIVTMDSLREMQLAAGVEVVALVKAPWVMLMTGSDDYQLSARNQLHGTVESVETGAVNAEVNLRLAGGAQLTAIVTREAVAELGLSAGTSATALIKASHIILGRKKG
jgi:molybdate transport system regulatory protein